LRILMPGPHTLRKLHDPLLRTQEVRRKR